MKEYFCISNNPDVLYTADSNTFNAETTNSDKLINASTSRLFQK